MGNTPLDYREANHGRLRASLIAAARELAVTQGWGAVRVVDVADAVGVSRQTVYNEFGNRAGLAESIAISEIERFVDVVRKELYAHGADLRAAAQATITAVLTDASANPLVRSILSSPGKEADELLPFLTTRSAVLDMAGQVVSDWIAAVAPELNDVSAALAAESIVRLTVSHIVLPSASPQASAKTLAEVLMQLLRPTTTPSAPA
ncbi:TetR family transcriptional regulator [Actinoplanes sp. Pm04-4]|uniref:TetR family transcriptional regulator n=1 Tax=Paractinoplanes pyxinae TaxID=2997416 RepID=A0ABT4BCD8_9ACTN|nr:TetR family transcriptional regulator [Actinoplanes pyxinae]MCY1144176.1 TetR family transcriptional regulator [Actinoplanes pyxinae]